MPKCRGCGKEVHIAELQNYVVVYQSWEGVNCCSRDCVETAAEKEGIDKESIIRVEQ